MVKERKFFICKHCGNILALINDAGAPVVCCGEKMSELVPNTVEASAEKHIPVVEQSGSILTVKVGSVAHPMTEQHYIMWVYLLTENGGQMKHLSPDTEPQVTFALDNDKAIAAYAYCNLHGLWKTDLDQ